MLDFMPRCRKALLPLRCKDEVSRTSVKHCAQTTIPADLIHKRNVPTEKSDEELDRLSSYPCCLPPRQKHHDFHDAPHIGNGRIPLPSVRKAVVDANCIHFVGRTGAVFHMTCPHIYFRRRFDRTPDKIPSVQKGGGDTPPMCRDLLEGPR